MRSWFYKDWKGQLRRQFGKILEARRVPARQNRQTRADGRIREKLLVKNTSQACNRRMVQAEMSLQEGRVLRIDPGRLVRRRQQDPSGIGLAYREQPLEESLAVALRWRGKGALGVARPCGRSKSLARDDIDVDAARAAAIVPPAAAVAKITESPSIMTPLTLVLTASTAAQSLGAGHDAELKDCQRQEIPLTRDADFWRECAPRFR